MIEGAPLVPPNRVLMSCERITPEMLTPVAAIRGADPTAGSRRAEQDVSPGAALQESLSPARPAW